MNINQLVLVLRVSYLRAERRGASVDHLQAAPTANNFCCACAMSQNGDDSGDDASHPHLPSQDGEGETRVHADDTVKEVEGQAAKGSSSQQECLAWSQTQIHNPLGLMMKHSIGKYPYCMDHGIDLLVSFTDRRHVFFGALSMYQRCDRMRTVSLDDILDNRIAGPVYRPTL